MIIRAVTNLTLYRGNTESLVFDFFERAGTDTPLNVLAEFEDLRFAIRVRQTSDSRLVIQKVLGGGIAVSDTNRVTVSYTAEETQSIGAGVYYFDFKTTDFQGRELTFFSGQVVISDNITL